MPEGKRTADWTACVMAGGASRRMGRDKSRIVVNGVSLLDRVKQTAAQACGRVMTIRRDALPNCGPLSGIYTGLLRAGTGWCVFLACDMPLISGRTLKQLVKRCTVPSKVSLVQSDLGPGFPLGIHTTQRERIRMLIEGGARSLKELADAVPSQTLRIPGDRAHELFNANTAEELDRLRQLIRSGESRPRGTI